MGGRTILVTGGVRSGKSAFALTEATMVKGERALIATAEPLDDEMRKRILEHRRARGDDWTTYEEPLRLSDVISEIRSPYKAIIVDCLTLWLSNMMLEVFIDISNVQIVCGSCSQPTRVGHSTLEDGEKLRICRKCEAEL